MCAVAGDVDFFIHRAVIAEPLPERERRGVSPITLYRRRGDRVQGLGGDTEFHAQCPRVFRVSLVLTHRVAEINRPAREADAPVM